MRRILFLALPLFLMTALSFRSFTLHTVTGTVKDEHGSPLSQVSIGEKGTQNGTASGPDGSFKITIRDANRILTFSALGFETQEVKVKGRTTVNVVLKMSTAQLEEVVVTGFSTIDMSAPSFQRQKALSGRAPGIAVSGAYGYRRDRKEFNTEDYDHIAENGFHKAVDDPLSTFSIDVDAASYSNVRRFLNSGSLPPAGAVRIEEMINYFRYDYPAPSREHPFSFSTEIAVCPWNTQHKLVMIGLQGKKIPMEALPPSNLVFLIDVSGSMQDEMKLPLVKSSLKLLVDQLREEDKISIVVYAGAAGMVLSPTSGAAKTRIKDAIDQLEGGGSTAGGEGIQLAYQVAKDNFRQKGNNRVILCTDGDFNVGVSSDDDLVRLIEKERESSVFLTILGYGMGNYKDNKMQKLADKGNGNHAYIDSPSEAKKVLVREFGGTLFTIAKDVKLQIEFNPAKVQGYRLIGYENRLLHKEDFNDDQKDAGELGSGHAVTALYEVIPVGVRSEFLRDVDPLKYQKAKKAISFSRELLTVKFRYKAPDGGKSQLVEQTLADQPAVFDQASANLRFAAAVASFGMLLRDSEYKGASSYGLVVKIASGAQGVDGEGYRREFINLVKKAALLKNGKESIDITLNE